MLNHRMLRTSRERIFFIVLFGLLFFFLAVRAALTFFRPLGPDELQHLHASWMVAHGYLPFKDFWENHAPTLYFMLAPLFRGEGNEIRGLFEARLALSILGLAILAQTYFVARRIHDVSTSLMAVLILSYTVIYAQRTIEVRPDQFLVIFWLAGFLLYLHAVNRQLPVLYFISGFLIGLGFLFSPKVLMPFAALILTALVCWFLKRSAWKLLDQIKKHLIFTAGFLVPIGVCLLFLQRLGILQPFFSCVLLENFSYPDVRRPTYLLRIKYLSTLLLMLTGVAMHVKHLWKKEEIRIEKVVILVPALFLLLIFLFFMPGAYPQSMLVFVPMLAIYGAEALMSAYAGLTAPVVSRKSALLFFFALLAVIIPMGDVMLGGPFSSDNQEQLNRFRYVLNFTPQSERLFDAESSYVFRPQAYYYGSLVAGNRKRFAPEELQHQIITSLVSSRCRIVFQDDWIQFLPVGVQSFLKDNYLQSFEPGILIAGKKLPLPDAPDAKISFEISVPLKYSIQFVGNAQSVALDGAPYSGPCFLKRGLHTLTWQRTGSLAIIKAVLP